MAEPMTDARLRTLRLDYQTDPVTDGPGRTRIKRDVSELLVEATRLREMVAYYWQPQELCPDCGWPIRGNGRCKCLDDAAAKETP